MITTMNDLEIQHYINQEQIRQQASIELIASENIVSKDVLSAQGSILTNRYCEGFPGKRYYGGQEVTDKIETLAIERAKLLFDCKYANVQPHSGSQANAAAYAALIESGDTVLGMDLSMGGHLTHGSKVNFSGKMYNFIHYGLDENGNIDYDMMEQLAEEHKPKLIVAGYSAHSRQLDLEKLREIADKFECKLMIDMAHFAGLVAAGFYKNPLKYADVVTTTTHKTLRGPRGGMILSDSEDEALHKKLNSAIFPGIQGGPLMHVIAAKAVALKEAMTYEYRVYISEVKACANMSADILKERGYKIVSDGTDNHMFLVDLSDKDISGKDAERWLEKSGITLNKNMVPGDKRSPFETSGIRIGLASLLSRGFVEHEIATIMECVADVLDSKGDPEVFEQVKEKCEAISLTKDIYASV